MKNSILVIMLMLPTLCLAQVASITWKYRHYPNVREVTTCKYKLTDMRIDDENSKGKKHKKIAVTVCY
jgi:hypothetical protein